MVDSSISDIYRAIAAYSLQYTRAEMDQLLSRMLADPDNDELYKECFQTQLLWILKLMRRYSSRLTAETTEEVLSDILVNGYARFRKHYDPSKSRPSTFIAYLAKQAWMRGLRGDLYGGPLAKYSKSDALRKLEVIRDSNEFLTFKARSCKLSKATVRQLAAIAVDIDVDEAAEHRQYLEFDAETIEHAINETRTLNDSHKKVLITLLYGGTCSQASRELGLCRERARQLRDAAINKIREATLAGDENWMKLHDLFLLKTETEHDNGERRNWVARLNTGAFFHKSSHRISDAELLWQ